MSYLPLLFHAAMDAPTLPQVDGIAPTFSTKPTIRQGPDGATLIFHCAIVADPKPNISWYHNGVKVQDNDKFQVSQQNTSRTVIKASFLAWASYILCRIFDETHW